MSQASPKPRPQLRSRKSVREFLEDHKDEELNQIKELWKQLDIKGKGKIGVTDLANIMRELGIEASDKEIKELINHLDSNGDGFISFEEFSSGVKWLKKANLLGISGDKEESVKSTTKSGTVSFESNTTTSSPKSRPRMLKRNESLAQFVGKMSKQQRQEFEKLFSSCKKDSNGRIGINDFIIILVELEPNLPEDDIRNLISQMDNGEGKIGFEEFMSGMYSLYLT